MRILRAAAAALGLTVLASCGAPAGSKDVPGHVTITVFADDSLKEPFTAIGKKYEKENAGVTVKFTFAGSTELVSQIKRDAPGDVLASGDLQTMAKVAEDGLITGNPAAIAKTALEIVTPRDNPAGISSLADLTNPGLNVVICAAEVPCGVAAHDVARAERITINPSSEEKSVTDVLRKVMSGDADAGLVFVPDVRAAGSKVEGVEFPESSKAVITFPIAALGRSRNIEDAKAFIEYVTSPEGRDILADAGFEKP
ncbi:molybdate ABC transporter substrate-binding protein [Aeromicrobium panaciterrae]|uniref:molybdate ABC transporter substrate-binding protein n=1 Tax=Aeromicrobium panaciterrae TaxID=363861 RepID=UPI0031D95890